MSNDVQLEWSDTLAITVGEIERAVERCDERLAGKSLENIADESVVEGILAERGALDMSLSLLVGSLEHALEVERDARDDEDFDTFSPMGESIEAGMKVLRASRE